MSRLNRRSLALFRCGVAPIRLETGRYVNLPVDERVCFNCYDCVEDEMHVLLKCPVYNDVRKDLLANCVYEWPDFIHQNDDVKVHFILASPSLANVCAKTCKAILNLRKSILYPS